MNLDKLPFFDISSALAERIFEFYKGVYNLFDQSILAFLQSAELVSKELAEITGMSDWALLNYSLNDFLFGSGLYVILAFVMLKWLWDTFNPFN